MLRVGGWRKVGRDRERDIKRDKQAVRDFAGSYHISPINAKINKIKFTERR
jgi:hypothetical protein